VVLFAASSIDIRSALYKECKNVEVPTDTTRVKRGTASMTAQKGLDELNVALKWSGQL
jgi:hypothetical protein